MSDLDSRQAEWGKPWRPKRGGECEKRNVKQKRKKEVRELACHGSTAKDLALGRPGVLHSLSLISRVPQRGIAASDLGEKKRQKMIRRFVDEGRELGGGCKRGGDQGFRWWRGLGRWKTVSL